MNLTLPIERRLIEAIRVLAPDKQQAVLDFAEFLQNQQRFSESNGSEKAPTVLKSAETSSGSINLAERGINLEEAADLRSRLTTFAEDWNRPEMAVYDEL